MNQNGLWDAFLSLLYPTRHGCLLCQQPYLRGEEAVCSPCQSHVQASKPPFCRVCGREMQAKGICTDCGRRQERFFQKAVSYGTYEGRLRELLLLLKKERREELLPLFVDRLAEVWAGELFDRGIEQLVPVPMGADKLKQRGFNQAQRLASGLSEQVKVPVVTALTWQGESRSQSSRNRADRLRGMDDLLTLSVEASDVAERTVCLVDDVYTTGTTANACAKKLHEAGARCVYVLTVAR